MSKENPGWGAPRIHGELLKLGMDVGETSVSTYLVRHRKPVGSRYSCRAGIVAEQASQTLPAGDAIRRAGSVSRLGEQQDVSLALMRTLSMVMRKVLV